MLCQNCNQIVSVKADEKKISLLCKCKIILIYPSSKVTIISKKEYDDRKNNTNAY